jgi:hypothetical protein
MAEVSSGFQMAGRQIRRNSVLKSCNPPSTARHTACTRSIPSVVIFFSRSLCHGISPVLVSARVTFVSLPARRGLCKRFTYKPTGGYTASSAYGRFEPIALVSIAHRLFPLPPWRALEFTDAESVDTDLKGSWERVGVQCGRIAYAICFLSSACLLLVAGRTAWGPSTSNL